MNWRDYISTIKVAPTQKGLSLSTSFILQLFAAGWTAEQILQNYPQLRPEHLRYLAPPTPVLAGIAEALRMYTSVVLRTLMRPRVRALRGTVLRIALYICCAVFGSRRIAARAVYRLAPRTGANIPPGTACHSADGLKTVVPRRSGFGTRPEAIKMAPVIKELEKAEDCFSLRVVVTAQHREMLDQVLALFGIEPDYDLDIMEPGQSLPDLGCRILSRLTPVFLREQPDLVMVHGDTSTTFLGALAAFYLRIPVAHVEAGLRTYQPYSPFPEEMNRRLTGALAAYHFAPTRTAAGNLLAERVPPAAVMVTGNVIDALRPWPRYGLTTAGVAIRPGRRCSGTHRRENLGEPAPDLPRPPLAVGRFPRSLGGFSRPP